jgi:pimeloyl-ACP methyl ester carboxylesterase
MTVAEYIAVSARDVPSSPRPDAVAEYRKLLVDNGVSGESVSRWFSAPLRATRDAAGLDDPVPLVLVAQGNAQSAFHQAYLSELLASDGFVVCTVPSPTRLRGPMRSEADILPYALAQADGLQAAIATARRELHITAGAPGVIGHSFGARAALLFAARAGARALVSLDGGIGFAEGRDWLTGRQTELLGQFRTPLLHIYETNEPAAAPDLTLLESLSQSPRLLLRIEGLRHIDFTSLGFATRTVPGILGESPVSLDAKLAAIAGYTRAFVRAWLQNDNAARASLDAAPTPSWLTVRRLPARSR